MTQRTEPRFSTHADIRVFGLDSRGRAVSVPARTIDISRHGARLEGVDSWERPGETIGIRYRTEKARYRVVWVGSPGSPMAGQIGVECLEMGKNIWGASLPAANEARLLGPRALGLVSVKKVGTELRRRAPRFQVKGSASVKETGKTVPQWTMLHDISQGGCYLETTAPLPVFTRIEATIHVLDIKVDVTGTVTTKHPLVGMGIKFTELSPLNRQRLQNLLERLEQAHAQTAGTTH